MEKTACSYTYKAGLDVRRGMYKKKTVGITIFFAALSYIVLRKAYIAYVQTDSKSEAHDALKSIKADENPSVIDAINGVYNYQRMLVLIERAQDIKKNFNAYFSGFPSKKKPIDQKATKALLEDLYREKIRLQRHIFTIKVQYKGRLPLKKARSLIYYQRVIERCIRDIENILRQI